jgi:hypothetical protein
VNVDFEQAIRQMQKTQSFENLERDDVMTTLANELPFNSERSVTDTLTRLAIQVPKLRVLADRLLCEERGESTTQATLHLIERCQYLNTALVTWRETIPEIWKYTSRPYDELSPDYFDCETSEVYPGNIDVYSDVWTAKTWNSYRTTRIFVQAIILRCIAWLAGGNMSNPCVVPQMAVAFQARNVVQEMVDEICASVPFHEGHSLTASEKKTLSFEDKPYPIVPNDQEDQTTESLGGFFLLWPLFLARSTRIISKGQKRWMTVRILNVARQLGLEKALVLTKLNEPPAQTLFGAPPIFVLFER